MSEMFRDPGQPGMFRPADWPQHLLLIEPRRFLENVPTSNGPADAVEARVHVLSAPGGPEVIDQARLFGAFASATRDAIGDPMPIVGRVLQFTSRAGGPAFRMEAASPEDKQYASGYWSKWQAEHPKQTGPALSGFDAPPMPQPQGYGAPSEQDRWGALQQQYDTAQLQQQGYPAPAQPPTAAPVQPAAAPAPAPAPQPTPAPVPAPEPGAAPVAGFTEAELVNLPPDLAQKLGLMQGGQQ